MKLKRSRLFKISQELDTKRAQELLKCYSSDVDIRDDSHSYSTKHGVLVWAKNVGSIYWPAFIVQLEDKPDLNVSDPQVSPGSCAFVIFLESKFRLSALNWERLIPVFEESFEEQMELIIKLNIVESKKPNCCTLLFKRSVEYLHEFRNYDLKSRYSIAQQKYLDHEATRVKSRRSYGGKQVTHSYQTQLLRCDRTGKTEGNNPVCLVVDGQELEKSRSGYSVTGHIKKLPSDWKNSKSRSIPSGGSIFQEDQTDCKHRKRSSSRSSNASFKKGEEPGRKHGRYSLRPVPLQSVLQIEPELSLPVPQSNIDTDDCEGETFAEEIEERKKGLRPKCGGKELKEWATEKFDMVDKTFKFESQKYLQCTATTCGKAIEGQVPLYCHDFPFHPDCVTEVKDGEETKFKCEMCVVKKCLLCKKSDGNCVKCSKCDFRYHIQCLRPFPQAEIQNETGPLTCPLHFCHTCIAEHEILKKVRNYKVCKSSSLRCLKCPTSYHRACVPASCISSITSNFLICPRHQNTQSVSKCRRLGCFMCNKRLVSKEKPTLVNCIKCPLTYHVQCVVDVASFEGNEDALNEYMSTFECESCFWGLYPLPGQTVWCQQASFSFWPARILYPKESSARTVHSPYSFSVVYFGSQQSYYDGARYSRVVPLNIGAYDVLKKIKMYTDDPKLMTAYEEGTYVMDMSECYRLTILQAPEPYYKKIEKNVYKLGKSNCKYNQKRVTHSDSTCTCHEDLTTAIICHYGSGCLNRDQAIECDDTTCKDPSRCTNRMFTRSSGNGKTTDSTKSAVTLEAFPTVNKGWGVRTTAALKRGDFVVEYVGEVISKELYQWRLQRKEGSDSLYFLELDTNLYIDAEYMGNFSRLINHSCDPNCSTEKYMSQGKQVVGIFANGDIRPGSELTFDYGYESSGKPFSCVCGASNCRGQINRSHIRNNKVGEARNESPSDGRLDEEWKDKCEVCSYPGTSLLCCEAPNCDKAYHASCLKLTSVPSGTWVCPEHTDLVTTSSKRIRKSQKKVLEAGKHPTVRNNKENLNKKSKANALNRRSKT
ncbi:unnamed protein product [Allacma fusca]|uniref:Histone-lysine N-methyltransferase n=1 Tax=Allacma fusca TaxID=39272 RepID=A0A8J2MGP0_9HEXA|nr:unnamed protein product [Allacma fusca]